MIRLVPYRDGICIEDKLTRSYMEDDFQVNEIAMMKKYIKPTDHRRMFIDSIYIMNIGCLFVVEGAVTGFMTSLCDYSYYLCTNRQQCLYISYLSTFIK